MLPTMLLMQMFDSLTRQSWEADEWLQLCKAAKDISFVCHHYARHATGSCGTDISIISQWWTGTLWLDTKVAFGPEWNSIFSCTARQWELSRTGGHCKIPFELEFNWKGAGTGEMTSDLWHGKDQLEWKSQVCLKEKQTPKLDINRLGMMEIIK